MQLYYLVTKGSSMSSKSRKLTRQQVIEIALERKSRVIPNTMTQAQHELVCAILREESAKK